MSLIMCVIVSMAIVPPRARGCGSEGVTLSIERFAFRACRVFALAFADRNEGPPLFGLYPNGLFTIGLFMIGLSPFGLPMTFGLSPFELF